MSTATQTFVFRAIDASGARHAGQLVSVSRTSALETLSGRGLIALELRSGSDATQPLWRRPRLWPRPLGARQRMSPRETLALTQSLAALVRAGLTIDRALQISALLASRSTSRARIEAILQEVRSGKPLSRAVGMVLQPLPPYFSSMIEAGEIGGSLPDALSRLAELMARQLAVRERIRSALVYPALLAGVVVITLILLLTFVLPRFDALFAESQATLPWSTRIVLSAGRFTAEFWWVLLLLGAGAALALATGLRSNAGRRRFDAWLLRTRLVLGLPSAIDTARMLHTLSTLCRNGLPLTAALRIARGTLANRRLVEALDIVAREVQSGRPFSQALEQVGVFPAVAVQLAKVGEETGRLDELLLSAATALDEDNQLKLERLLTLIVPLLTIAMGFIVAGLIGSVLIGLLSINDLAF